MVDTGCRKAGAAGCCSTPGDRPRWQETDHSHRGKATRNARSPPCTGEFWLAYERPSLVRGRIPGPRSGSPSRADYFWFPMRGRGAKHKGRPAAQVTKAYPERADGATRLPRVVGPTRRARRRSPTASVRTPRDYTPLRHPPAALDASDDGDIYGRQGAPRARVGLDDRASHLHGPGRKRQESVARKLAAARRAIRARVASSDQRLSGSSRFLFSIGVRWRL